MKQKPSKIRYRIPKNYSVRYAILDILLDIGENFPLFETPYMRMKKSWRRLRGAPPLERWRYNRAMRYLEQAGQVGLTKKGDKLFVELTRKGKLNALLSRLARDFRKRKEWDRKWRIMIWDIPEDSRSQRNSIRWFVRNLGFYQLQQSVFITPHALPYSAVQYLEESGLIRYIRLMRVDQMDNQNLLLKHFDLKTPDI